MVLFKMGKHSDFHLGFFQIVGAWRDFTVTKLMIFQFIDWLKFETRPSSLLNFGTAYSKQEKVLEKVTIYFFMEVQP